MDSKAANLEERLKSLLVELISESGILERIIHKNKNQHRRSLYFQALLKVRRDLRLLQLANLNQILNSFVPIIKGTNPVEHACHPKQNQKKYLRGRNAYQNRLLGVARLLSQMVEPILQAAVQISLLLAKTFFMTFSLTILACLARLRILVQQILIHVVSVFNMASAHLQKHSLKLPSKETEVCVEYYCANGIMTLECVWEDDKYVLREISPCDSAKIPEERGAVPLTSPIEYQTLELLGQGLGIEHDDMGVEESAYGVPQAHAISSSSQVVTSETSIKGTNCEESPIPKPACSSIAGKVFVESSITQTSRNGSRKRAAFVAVEISKPCESQPTQSEKKMRLNIPSSINADDGRLLHFPFTASNNVSLF